MVQRSASLGYVLVGVVTATWAQVLPPSELLWLGHPGWFLLLLVVCHWLKPKAVNLIMFAWLLGIWQDSLTGGLLGKYALLNTIIVALLEQGEAKRRTVIQDGRQLIIAILAVCVYYVMFFGLTWMTDAVVVRPTLLMGSLFATIFAVVMLYLVTIVFQNQDESILAKYR